MVKVNWHFHWCPNCDRSVVSAIKGPVFCLACAEQRNESVQMISRRATPEDKPMIDRRTEFSVTN